VSGEPWAGPGATVRLAGIPIRVEPAFVLVLGLLGFAGRGTLLAAIEWVGRYNDSVRLGTALVERQGDVESAYAAAWIARSLSLARDEVGAVTWLRRAVDGGLVWPDTAGHEDFASLAGNTEFEVIRSSESSTA
jgi:hypothetical protein